MKPKAALWIAALLFLVSCQLPGMRPPASSITPSPVPTREVVALPPATPVCVPEEPTQLDIDRALEFTGDMFSAAEWERSYMVMDKRVGVTWTSNAAGAVVYLEVLIFPCGYEDQDVDGYFVSSTWDVIFENYDSYAFVDECQTGSGLRLYEIDAKSSGFDYDIRYWANNDTANRVITVMMTFPVGSDALLDSYAVRLFPPLKTCP